MSQLASSVSKLEAQGSGKIPFQTLVNPKENDSAIVLRSGKELEEPPKRTMEKEKANKVGCNMGSQEQMLVLGIPSVVRRYGYPSKQTDDCNHRNSRDDDQDDHAMGFLV